MTIEEYKRVRLSLGIENIIRQYFMGVDVRLKKFKTHSFEGHNFGSSVTTIVLILPNEKRLAMQVTPIRVEVYIPADVWDDILAISNEIYGETDNDHLILHMYNIRTVLMDHLVKSYLHPFLYRYDLNPFLYGVNRLVKTSERLHEFERINNFMYYSFR